MVVLDMPQRLKFWLDECRQPSTAYKIACLLIVLTHIGGSYLTIELMLGQMVSNTFNLLLRLTCEALSIIFVCHFLMRPFLRLGILRSSFNWKSAAGLLVYTFPVAIFLAVLMFGLAQVASFSDFDITSVQFSTKSGDVSDKHMATSAYIINAGQQYVFLIFWSAIYLSWHFYRKRDELSKELEVARLKQLANQINPHFLFNTLNSIRALVYSNKDQAAETITQLSELMRVHMHAEVETLSTFAKEKELAQSYLDIEKLRLQERLQLDWQVDQEALSVTMPSLVLLTLMENAIKYGIAPSAKPGQISVRASIEQGTYFRLVVSNSLPLKTVGHGAGIGLQNIRKRLQLLYSEKAKLKINHAKNFTVELELPIT